MKKRLCQTLLLLAWVGPLCAQQQFEFKIHGVVLDSTTALPIAHANVWTANHSTATDVGGNFYLTITSDDTIHFSHISYMRRSIHGIHFFDQSVVISMRQAIKELSELQVYSTLSEQDFKDKVMSTRPPATKKEEIAIMNARMTNYVTKYGPLTPMSAYDNFKELIRGPQGVVILSTGANKGLIRAIRNIVKPQKATFKKITKSDSTTHLPRH